MKLPFSLLAIACVLSASASLRAGQLVNYDFTTNTNATFLDTTLVASSSAFVYSDSNGGWSSGPGGSNGNVYARLTDLTTSLTSAHYFNFTLTPQDGESLNLGLLTFNYGYQNSGSSAHPAYTLYYQVGVTVAGGSEVIIPTVFSYSVAASSTGTNALDGSASLDLSAYSQLQGVTSSVTITFYVYTQVTSGTATVNETARIDNVSLTTATAIPEPASVALVMGGSAGLLFFFVRRRGRR